jgi:hypothetical protein
VQTTSPLLKLLVAEMADIVKRIVNMVEKEMVMAKLDILR